MNLNRHQIWIISLIAVGAVAFAITPELLEAKTPPAQGFGLEAARAVARPPVLHLTQPRPLSFELASDSAPQSDDPTPLQARALAMADFDEDGTPDLVCGFASGEAGVLTLQRGNVDSIFPDTPAATRRRVEGSFVDSPFFPEARPTPIDHKPDFVQAGDFDADGHQDLVTASRSDHRLWFHRGDGRGSFGTARELDVEGNVTALLAADVNRRDGLEDLLVGVSRSGRSSLLVLEDPSGALLATPEVHLMDAPVVDIATGQLDEAFYIDLAVVAGDQLVVIHGRDRQLTRRPFRRSVRPAELKSYAIGEPVDSLAVGDFLPGPGLEIAVLASAGRVIWYEQETTGEFLFSQEVELPLTGRISALTGWDGANQPRLVRLRVSTSPLDDLLVYGTSNDRIHIISRALSTGSDPAVTARPALAVLQVSGPALAALPARLNKDALSDLVVLQSGPLLSTIQTTTKPAFYVNRDGPETDPALGDNVCDIDLNTPKVHECTLRAAIMQANASAGQDEIRFSIDQITQNAGGRLTEAVTIDGSPGRVVLTGTQATLEITGGDSLIRGLVVFHPGTFFGTAIDLRSGNNRVEGCYLGTDETGSESQEIGNFGVSMSSSGNTVGGTQQAARNVISASRLTAGVLIANANVNQVIGNYIGTDAVGARDFGSAGCGVEIFDSTNSQVGGAENEGNLISGNDLGGGCLNRSEGTLIQGNMIDTTPDGEEAFVTSLPSSADGVSAVASSGNTIGGTFPKAGNIIAVGGVGVRILPLGANRSDENKIFGNRISVDSTGTKALGEGKVGVSVDGSNNQVGSGLENGVNTVAFQTGDGIRVTRGTNEILYNSTFSNGGLGIELGGGNGVNENDDLDADDGPNGLQNFPVLEGAGDSTIGGFLDSKPNTDYLLEFYRSDECDPSGHGEGKTYLGTLDGVRTDALGRAEFDTAFGADSGFVTATATEASDEGLFGTSEFSACLEFSPPLTFVVNSSGDAAEPVEKRGDGECWTGGMIEREEKEKTKKECTLRAAITEANLVKGANRIHFDIPGDQVHTLQPVVGVQAGLPAITGKVWIDGNTQPGAARATEDRPAMLKIEIDGSRAGPDAIGLSLASGSEESRISGLVINRFLSTGVLLQAAGSTVDGNHIGSDATGTTEVVPLQPFGVAVENSAGNSIGGPGAGLGNIIFGRVDVRGAGSRFNQILGNFIAAGDDAGIAIFQGGSNTVGTEAHGNTIVGAFAAINIHLSEDNEIVGNHVGCDCPEGGIRTNQRGVVILNSPRTVIRENTIQGTQSLVLAGGIFVSGKMSTQTMVLGNFVHANRGDGITVLSDAAQTTIRGNAILENEGHGIAVRARASETMIWNNFIEGNKAHGVLVDENASDTLIGDLDPAKRNIILNNGGFKDEINAEVRISRSRRNKILSNQIGAPGIVLRNRGDTKERELDAEDRDRGPNDLINHPVIQSVSSQPGSSSVVVVLSNPPSQNIVQLFDNAACVEGRGGGESLIEMKLDIETFEYFGATVTFNPGPLTEGHFLTATVTDAEGNTSEFSDCFQVLPDSDVDGVADETEDQLTPTGDGNSDGTADSQQPLVLTRADRQGRPFTMEGTAGVERLEMGSSLPSLFPPDDGAAAESVWLTEPSEVRAEMNQGTVPLGQPGEVTLTVFFPPDLVPETYVNFGPTPEDPVEHAYEFLFDGTTGAEILADQIVLHFIDGERGDHDLSVNGEILTRGAPAAAARRFYFPQIGDGLVANIQLQSSSILGNTGVFSPVQLELFDSLGGFFEVDFGELGKSSIFQIALEEGESISAQSAGTEAIQAGYAEVIARPPVGGTAVFSRRDATTDTLLYEAGVPASDPLTDFTVYVDTVGIRETGLAIAYPSSGSSTSPAGAADANLILRLYDAGFNLLETANLSLAPGTHQAKFIPQFFEGNPQATEMEGTVTVESDAPVAAVTLRQNDDPAVSCPQEVPTLATFPVVPGRADDPASSAQGGMHSTFFFPQVGDGTVASIRLQTSLIFVNAGAGTDLLLEFFDSLGDPLPLDLGDLGTESSFDLNLGSGEALSVLTAGTGAPQVGYARVTTSPAVGGTAVFTRADVPSGSLLYEAGVPASTPLSDLSMVVDTSGDRSTGLALVVPPDAAPSGDVSVILRLFDQAFSLLSEVTLQLAPGEHLPRFVDQLFPDVEGIDEMEGSLTIESSVPLAAVTIRQNDQPGVEFPNEVPTLTTFPVIQGRAAR